MGLFDRGKVGRLEGELADLRAKLESRDARPRTRERKVYLQAPAKRSFPAGGTSSMTYSWTSWPLSSDQLLVAQLRPLRARSREQACSNDYMKKFLRLVATNVAGPMGVTMQATCTLPNGEPDTEASSGLEAAWADWGKPGVCDVEGQRSWIDQQRLFVTTVAQDGEYLARKIRGREAGPHGFALQVLDPELLDVGLNTTVAGGGFIRMGIEFNRWSRPVAYHLIEQDPSSSIDMGYSGLRYVRVPAEEIIHRFLPELVGQKRGIPWASTALLRMSMLSGYEDAALVNARAGAAKLAALESESGEPGFVGDDVETSGAEGDTSGIEYLDAGEPGSLMKLPAGTKLSSIDWKYPDSEFGGFVKATLRGISSGLDVDYVSLSSDLEGVSYSSIRAGVLEQREVWKGLQQWAISAFIVPVYEAWLPMALMSGAVKIGGKAVSYLPEREEKFRAVSWMPRRWAWVDPQSDVDANVTAIGEGLRSRSEVIRDQGRDPEDVWDEIRAENEKLKALGIKLGKSAPTPAPAPFKQSSTGSDNDPTTEGVDSEDTAQD